LIGSRPQALAKMVYRGGGTRQQSIVHGLARANKSIAERVCVGRAVAFDDDTTQAQQRGPVVTPVVDLVSETIENRPGDDSGGHGKHVALELGAHHLADHAGQDFDGLEHDVADEAVAYDDVDGALANVVALDVAVEVETTAAQ